MTLDEGIETMRKCIQELKTRFIINQPTFVAKIVTKEGIRVIDLWLSCLMKINHYHSLIIKAYEIISQLIMPYHYTWLIIYN
jgi:hypothetical protein